MKLSDIFSLNLNSKGGAKLFKKIANKYNLDYKQVRKSVEENVGGGGAKEYYYLFDADKALEAFGMSEEEFNAALTESNGVAISLFFYGALNFIVGSTDHYYREYVIANQLSKFTSINVFKKIKAIKLYDNITPMEIFIDTEHYSIVGNLEDRYIKQKNISDFDLPNPALYTTPITKEEYEALIDVPSIIV